MDLLKLSSLQLNIVLPDIELPSVLASVTEYLSFDFGNNPEDGETEVPWKMEKSSCSGTAARRITLVSWNDVQLLRSSAASSLYISDVVLLLTFSLLDVSILVISAPVCLHL